MNRELIEARKKYEKLEQERRELLSLEEELLKLETDEKVKRYLELTKVMENKTIPDEDSLIEQIFHDINLSNFDKIYFKYGMCCRAYGKFQFTTRIGQAEYILYKNLAFLDDEKRIVNNPDCIHEFESNHQIVRIDGVFSPEQAYKMYCRTRSDYYKLLLTEDNLDSSYLAEKLRQKVKML